MSIYPGVVFNLPINKIFFYKSREEDHLEVGERVVVPFGKRKLTGFVVAIRNIPPAGVPSLKEIVRVVDSKPVFNKFTIELAEWVSGMYLCGLGEALSAILPGGKRETEITYIPDSSVTQEKFELDLQQINAIKKIINSRAGFFYLHGVTGSGKTEVFLNVAKHMLARRRGVIYLVPEISLTHQVIDIFTKEFKGMVSILHSGFSPSQRLKEWMKLLTGDTLIAIGARSAVFAPVKNLGLIILDEEHETTYKSNFTPRYHARQIAMHRSRTEEAVLLMGSATPSVEAYHYMQKGVITRLSLPKRLSGGKMPAIEIVDMRKEKSILSSVLVKAMRETLNAGQQVILFLNRRGFAYYFHCRSCGYEMKCKNCSVPMTYHKSTNEMICHYCGYRTKPITECPVCHSLDVGYSGFGTERVEEEIRSAFPAHKIQRVDTDTVRKKNFLRKILKDFREKNTDILLGTQMVAKGLNFPGVKLVGIVLADTDLQLPDFRSQEKTFQLITQVAGRAGRIIPDGYVIIQTFRPESEVIKMAAAGEIEKFYKNEINQRLTLKFPPFYRLIRLVFRGRKRELVEKTAESFLDDTEKRISCNIEILGPVECPLAVISHNYRVQLLFRSEKFSAMHAVIKKTLLQFTVPRGVFCEVDIDPVSLL
ncbi:MAG: primosomal protein N' [Spirochaetes bacterium]|nr:MAG: primosomal protein N' [Spirochaetota bacterium]